MVRWVKVYKCLNCGLIFKNPKIGWLDTGSPVAACPRCKSDAVVSIEVCVG